MKKSFFRLLIIVFITFISVDSFSQRQQGPPAPRPGMSSARPDVCFENGVPGLCPIDDKIILLLISGVIFGVRRLRTTSEV